MVTTISLNIPEEQLSYIEAEIQKGRYRDVQDFLGQFFDQMFDLFDFNHLVEQHVEETIKKGSAVPFPAADSLAEVEKYLDEVQSRPAKVTDLKQVLYNVRDRAFTRYDELQRPKKP